MDPDIKKRWVDALRSGEYKQGQECLHDSSNNSFCCLGVLTDLYIKEYGQQWNKPDGDTQLTFEDQGGVLPGSVITWAGLNMASPYVNGCDIASHNDNGATFDILAEMIEAEL
jgi:hypothetical protein